MVKYSFEEVQKSTLDYFKGDVLASDVWIKKYCLKDSENNYYELNPNDMHKRLAKEFARIEKNYPNSLSEGEIFELLDEFKYFVPGGSNLFGIGNDFQLSSLSNCFYIHHDDQDSYGGIMKLDEELVHLFKRRCGVGIDVSFLRPKDTAVNNAAVTTTGAVSFMDRFSNTTKEVALNGRRAALMITMDVRHPEILDFINVKKDLKKVTGANISIKFNDEFFDKLKKNEDFTLKFPIDSESPIITKNINPNIIWDSFVDSNYSSAEPGFLNWEHIQRESVSDMYEGFELQGVNPCAELTLSKSESCRLASINLYSFVDNPFTKDSKFNFEKLKEVVEKSMYLMDDIVELEVEKVDTILNKIKNIDPENLSTKVREIELWEIIKEKAINGRRTGLGITGMADMLAALGITYATTEGNDFCTNIFRYISTYSYTSSIKLAKERGCFPIWNLEKEKDSPFIKRILYDNDLISKEVLNDYETYGRRHIGLLTIAPNGTLGLITKTSSGVEPVFMLTHKRRRRFTNSDTEFNYVDSHGDKWVEYIVFHPKFKEYLEINNILIDESNLSSIIESSPYYKSESNTIDYMSKVYLQASLNKYIDHSISVTQNLPSTITKEEVSKLYLKAHELGCKGFTIYVDGSRDGVLVSTDSKKEVKEIKLVETKRPESLPCDIHHISALGKKWYVIIGLKDNKPYELFTLLRKGIHIPDGRKSGELIKIGSGKYNLKTNGFLFEDINQFFENPEDETDVRLISGMLKHSVSISFICNQLDKAKGSVVSLAKAISRTFKKHYLSEKDFVDMSESGERCPECGSKLVYKEGCKSCASECGWSKCG